MKLIRKTKINKPEKTYNLHIKKDHNYIANGLVASNCHLAKADVLKKLLTGPMKDIPLRWGLTGTIPEEEHQQISLLSSIGPTINQLTAKELQDSGVLSNCHVNIMQIQDSGEYNTYAEELKYLVTNEPRMEFIAKTIEKIAETGNTLVLVDRLRAGELLEEYIPNTKFVSGSDKSDTRQNEYDKINVTDNSILIATYGVASTGLNMPRIFNLVMVEPGKSYIKVVQSIGRGIRKAKDKDYVDIWDFTSSLKYSKRHLTKRKKFYKKVNYPFSITKISR